MALTTVPVYAAALVLVISAVAKIARPTGTVVALQAVRIRVGSNPVYALAAFELLVGAAVIASAAPIAIAAMGALYVGFALFALAVLRRGGPAASCGCFGEAATPVHPIHVVIDLAVAALAIAALIVPPSPPTQVSVAAWFACIVLTAAIVTALTVLPQTLASASRVLRSNPTET